MLTQSYAQTTNDGALLWATLHEWVLREQSYRESHPEDVPEEQRLAEMVPARDAGDVCGVCDQLVTWVDHLPPLKAGGTVRCFVGVTPLRHGSSLIVEPGVVIDDIFPRVD